MVKKDEKKKYHLRAIKTNTKLDISGVEKGSEALDVIEEGIED